MPPQPKSEKNLPQINLSSREIVTQQQLQSLLGAAMSMWSAMQGPPRHRSLFFQAEEETHTETAVEKTEGWIAAENCFIKICGAIEKIVDDPKRWDCEFQKKMEDDYNKAMAMNLEYIQANRDAAKEKASPHAICNPQLARCPDGSYVAFIGDPNTGIVGAGRSPQEALDAFDLAFKGVVAESVKEVTEKQEQKQNEQQKQKLGQERSAETPEPPKRRRIYPRNSGGSGTKPESGGESAV